MMPHMLRRNTVLFLALLLPLSACSGSKKNCAEEVQVASIRLCLPRGWEHVPESTLKEKKVPEETVAAFHRTDESGGQRDNVVITRESLPGKVSDIAYAEANIKSIAAIPEYSLIDKREVKIDGNVTLLHIFTARPVPDVPVRRFYQLSLTRDSTGYTFTGTLPYSIEKDVEETILGILQSVRFKAEEEKEE